jgi:hypothetical protein
MDAPNPLRDHLSPQVKREPPRRASANQSTFKEQLKRTATLSRPKPSIVEAFLGTTEHYKAFKWNASPFASTHQPISSPAIAMIAPESNGQPINKSPNSKFRAENIKQLEKLLRAKSANQETPSYGLPIYAGSTDPGKASDTPPCEKLLEKKTVKKCENSFNQRKRSLDYSKIYLAKGFVEGKQNVSVHQKPTTLPSKPQPPPTMIQRPVDGQTPSSHLPFRVPSEANYKIILGSLASSGAKNSSTFFRNENKMETPFPDPHTKIDRPKRPSTLASRVSGAFQTSSTRLDHCNCLAQVSQSFINTLAAESRTRLECKDHFHYRE